MKWYYSIDGEAKGPFTRIELESFFTAGQITVATLVVQEGMYDWIPFVDLKKTTQILPVFGAPPPAKAE